MSKKTKLIIGAVLGGAILAGGITAGIVLSSKKILMNLKIKRN
ncbi:hypothetical protein NW064_02595 [Mycoplasmopsis felis]|nr:hypothetical protein [Mycoplasmopsis felis]UWW01259.1 hypothetical protein NW064_02595 [Mycoplasmopsis felis]